jgi:hypothetical protein
VHVEVAVDLRNGVWYVFVDRSCHCVVSCRVGGAHCVVRDPVLWWPVERLVDRDCNVY